MKGRSGGLRPREAEGPAAGPGQDPWKKRYDEIFSHEYPASTGVFQDFPPQVSQDVAALLTQGGKRRPYTHQAGTAAAALVDGKNVVLVTQVASGKTTAFLSVVLTLLQRNPVAIGLLLYPMNALAEDQLLNLIDLGFEEDGQGTYTLVVGGVSIIAGVLTGDTPDRVRRRIRREARLILTNQVMLHAGVLSYARHQYADGTSWDRLFRNLKVFVMDEGHSQFGPEGTETALALRRLWAQVQMRGQDLPTAIICSATIGNPVAHAEGLTGLFNWTLIDKSGAKSHPRTLKIIAPSEHPRDGKWAASVVALELAVREIGEGSRALIFVRSKAATEAMKIRLNEKVGPNTCIAYNAGIPPDQKKDLLRQILNGKVRAVASTSALELGVDIGGLDVVILVGHPGDQASLFQRAGRVGRTAPGRVYLVLDETQHAMNSYIESVPAAVLDPPESRTIYPENERLSLRHAACCFLETGGDEALVSRWFPKAPMDAVKSLSEETPHAMVSMIGKGSLPQYTLFQPDGTTRIQVMAGDDALLYWHRGALARTVDGKVFKVAGLDHDLAKGMTNDLEDARYAHFSTSPIIDTRENPIDVKAVSMKVPARLQVAKVVEGEFRITAQTIAYKVYPVSGKVHDGPVVVPLSPLERNPIRELVTRGAVVTFSPGSPLLGRRGLPQGGAEVLADVLRQAVPVVIQARPADLLVKVEMNARGQLDLTVLDHVEGGMAWTETLIRHMSPWFRATGKLLGGCRCKMKGCPRCSLARLEPFSRGELAEALAGETLQDLARKGGPPAGPVKLVKKA